MSGPACGSIAMARQGRGPGERARGDPRRLHEPVNAIRHSPVSPHPPAAPTTSAHPPGRLPARRPHLPVLRPTSQGTDSGPRHPAPCGGQPHVGKRGQRLQGVQSPQGRPDSRAGGHEGAQPSDAAPTDRLHPVLFLPGQHLVEVSARTTIDVAPSPATVERPTASPVADQEEDRGSDVTKHSTTTRSRRGAPL